MSGGMVGSGRVQVVGSFARTGIPLPVSTTAYNAANELTQWGTATLTYDANGNMLSSGSDGYTWDARNHLVSTLSGASFKYDPFGRRASKTVSGATTNFLYDGVNPVQELSGATVTANLLTGLSIDEYFTRTDSAGARNFLTDPLGTAIALADSTGALQTQYTYDPFGNTSATGQASGNPYQYTGRENDGTGLYFYRARYYSPMFGRFISEDPLGFRGSLDTYAYAGDSPAFARDPLGLTQCPRGSPCLQNCLTDRIGRNTQRLRQNLTRVARAGPAVGAGICAALVVAEPELLPFFPECTVGLTLNAVAVGSAVSVGWWNISNLASTLGCVVSCSQQNQSR